MRAADAYIYAALIVLAVLAVLAFAWYHYPGSWEWRTLTSDPTSGGDTRVGLPGANAGQLRFKNASFTAVSPEGDQRTWDVSGTLNSMAAGHNVQVSDPSIRIHGTSVSGNEQRINPLSFVLAGWNDARTVDAAGRSAWEKGYARLTFQVRAV